MTCHERRGWLSGPDDVNKESDLSQFVAAIVYFEKSFESVFREESLLG